MHRLQKISGHISASTISQMKTIETVRHQFDLSTSKLSQMQTYFFEEMMHGLEDEKSANIKMLLSFVPKKPVSDINGTFYALDLGGTNFRVIKLVVQAGNVISNQSNKFSIPKLHMTGNAEGLFGFIAESVATMADKAERGKLGFTFSFPVVQTSLNSGNL